MPVVLKSQRWASEETTCIQRVPPAAAMSLPAMRRM